MFTSFKKIILFSFFTAIFICLILGINSVASGSFGLGFENIAKKAIYTKPNTLQDVKILIGTRDTEFTTANIGEKDKNLAMWSTFEPLFYSGGKIEGTLRMKNYAISDDDADKLRDYTFVNDYLVYRLNARYSETNPKGEVGARTIKPVTEKIVKKGSRCNSCATNNSEFDLTASFEIPQQNIKEEGVEYSLAVVEMELTTMRLYEKDGQKYIKVLTCIPKQEDRERWIDFDKSPGYTISGDFESHEIVKLENSGIDKKVIDKLN